MFIFVDIHMLMDKHVSIWLIVIGCFLGIDLRAQTLITLRAENEPLEDVLAQLKKQADLHFVYNDDVLRLAEPVNLQVVTKDLNRVLKRIFDKQPFSYSQRGKVVVIFMTPGGKAARALRASSERSMLATDTAKDGSILLSEVVVTGIVTRLRNNYTSSTAAVAGADLRMLNPMDVFRALRVADPSFVVFPNNMRGSDPNTPPQVEIRGKTSLSGLTVEDQYGMEPNQPIFILDGFESSLRQISTLDMNRIESVTLLKDAASASLYGARSANGVVVVETVKPRPGELTVFYNTDVQAEMADLTDYNMMNAAGKLEFERLAGRFKPVSGHVMDEDPIALERAYNDRLREVLRGVDNYWLDVPLRVGISQNQSLYFQKGSERWQYGAGGNYRSRNGVMKGSGNTLASGWSDVFYRSGKWNLQGKTLILHTSDFDSPSSDFSLFVKQSPQYSLADTARYLAEMPVPGQLAYQKEPNHIYNTLLRSYQRNRSLSLQQNLSAWWYIKNDLQIVSRLQLAYEKAEGSIFTDPADTKFEMSHPLERGALDDRSSFAWSYQANIMAIWNRRLGEKHHMILNARAEVQQNDLTITGYQVNGFPENAVGKVQESFNELPLPADLGSPPMIRRANILASANYVYDHRLFLDLTARTDGSTQFGSANRYAAFWSAGLGWNMHREPVLNNWSFLDVFRLKFNTGLTGNQNFGSFASSVVYAPVSDAGGLFHYSLGNPNLQWQKTYQSSLGLDTEWWDGRIIFNVNVFDKLTSPLIATIDLPPSTGVSGYHMNVGGLRVNGVEGILYFSPVFQSRNGWNWRLGANTLMYRGRYQSLSAVFEGVNEHMKDSQLLERYQDGYGPGELWAVRSLGIDPATGREVFLKKNGDYTFDYDADDVVPMGSGLPRAEGVMSSLLHYRELFVGIYFRYSLRARRFNTALYEKVENISFADLSSNQDRRALEDRWQQPGDPAKFRGISLLEETPMSSRFIQKEDVLSVESISVGYRFEAAKYRGLHKMNVSLVRLTANMNDPLRWSTMLAERGIMYPFSRSFSCSLGVVF